ncbi:MAG TPA: hypothetical protein VGA85_05180 [Dehalococcoidales bacterium]
MTLPMRITPSRQVFVLGAGFTHAFCPSAPLMVDDYGVDTLLEKFNNFPLIRSILESEKRGRQDNKINIERLLTRLHTGMPHDIENKTELSLLYTDLEKVYLSRIKEALTQKVFLGELTKFAKFCIDNRVTCISFNHDDLFDKALFDVNRVIQIPLQPVPYWHPDGGYGFFCRPAVSCILDTIISMDKTSMMLLKLHGSTNWFPRFGHTKPFTLDSIVHYESWLPYSNQNGIPIDEEILEKIPSHIATNPFLIPPVLVKGELTEQPIIRLIWSSAYTALKQADKVTFIGYSLPITDIAATYLFSETISGLPGSSIHIVNRDEKVKDVYRKTLPQLIDENFITIDALEWVKGVTNDDSILTQSA